MRSPGSRHHEAHDATTAPDEDDQGARQRPDVTRLPGAMRSRPWRSGPHGKTQPSRRSTVRTSSTAVPRRRRTLPYLRGHRHAVRRGAGTAGRRSRRIAGPAGPVHDRGRGRGPRGAADDTGLDRSPPAMATARGRRRASPGGAADRRDVVIPGARGGHRRDRRERVVDDLPVEVVEHATDGLRRVLVDPETGDETLGPLVDGPDAVWLAEWWPLDTSRIGDRAEVGRPRDTAWSAAVRSLTRGVAIAIDYCHDRGDRAGRDVVGGHAHGLRRRPTRRRCRTGAATSPVTSRWTHAPRPAAQWRIVVVARPATRGPHALGVNGGNPARTWRSAIDFLPRALTGRRRRRGSFGAVGWATSAGSSSAWAFRCRPRCRRHETSSIVAPP